MKKNTTYAMGQRIAKTVTNKNVTTGDKFVTTYYVRDPQGNVLAVYEHKHGDSDNGTFTLAEQHLYGAGRLGMRKRDLALNVANASESTPAATHYELTNHLGNVMAVISDEASTADEPTVVSLSDYYPFGMTEPGRSWNSGDYRFGYTGHEKEEDLASGVYTTEYRLLDTRLGRWMSVDKLAGNYVGMSPYNYCLDNPSINYDPDGRCPAVAIPIIAYGPEIVMALGATALSVTCAKWASDNIHITFSRPEAPSKDDIVRILPAPAPPTTSDIVESIPMPRINMSDYMESYPAMPADATAVEIIPRIPPSGLITETFPAVVEVPTAIALFTLRENLGITGSTTLEAHHIIPNQLRTNPAVAAAISAGFMFDDVVNGIALEKFRHGVGVHANHPNYTTQVENAINAWAAKRVYTAEEAKTFIEGLASTIKDQLIDQCLKGGKKVQEVELDLKNE